MNHFVFVFVFSVVVGITILQVYLCVASAVGYIFRWHIRFVSIVVGVGCMGSCRLNVLAKLIGLVSFYVGFGVLLTQIAVWQSCGVGVVSARCDCFCFLSLQLWFAFICTGVRLHFLFHRNQFLI